MNTRYHVLLIIIAVVALVSCSGAYSEIFLNVDGIPGESAAKGYEGCIEAISITFPATMPVARTHEGAALTKRTDGQAKPGSLTITKVVDKASPKLFEAAARGTLVPTVVIDMTRDSSDKGKYVKYMEYKLTNVMVSSCKVAAPVSGSGKLPTEKITFNYQKMELSYTATPPLSAGQVARPDAAMHPAVQAPTK